MTTATNADPQELAKFSELAHRWWDPVEILRQISQQMSKHQSRTGRSG